MKILFVGDVMLGRLVNEVLRRQPPEFPWGGTLPLFQQADWRICNLECVLSDDGSPWSETPKAFHFRSDARNVAVLQAGRINAVSLANNHSLDYGCDAMLECLHVLDQAGIQRAGAGRNLTEASQPAVAQAQGIKLGYIAFTDNEPAWEATSIKAGTFFVPIDLKDSRAVNLLELVAQTKKQADLLVVSAHWGGNWGEEPPPEHILFGHALIEAGADVIFGHSCHIFRGVEIYRQRPILYSTGDFVDDYAVDPDERNDQSFIFVVEISGGAIQRLKLYPTVIRKFQAMRATPVKAEEITRKMIRLCAQLKSTAVWSMDKQHLEIRW